MNKRNSRLRTLGANLLKARLKWACLSDEGVQKAFIATGAADCILEALGRLLVIRVISQAFLPLKS